MKITPWSHAICYVVIMIAFSAGCAGNPSVPDVRQPEESQGLIITEPQNTPQSINTSTDMFLGEFQIDEVEGEIYITLIRKAQADINATDFLSVTNPAAPLYLWIVDKVWIDDPDEPDPAQGTRIFTLELKNNTGLQIYDPWLIFTDLGQKTYINPAGITSRAYVPSKPYASFAKPDGTIGPHSSQQAICEVFFPKTQPTLSPCVFAAYGSYPEDYIDVGEGHSNPELWRNVYDSHGGRSVVGSATQQVQPFGGGFSQIFTGGSLILNPTDGEIYYMPKDFSDSFWSVNDPVNQMGYPSKALLTWPDHPEFESNYGTHFAIMEFSNDASIYKHVDGVNTGLVVPVPNGFNAAWRDQVGAWGNEFGLPVTYHPDAGQSSFGTQFDMMTFEGDGEIYKHISGEHEGDTWAVPEDYLAKWEDNEEGAVDYNGKYSGALGLPTEYIKKVGSPSHYNTEFGVMHFEGTGTFWKHLSGIHADKIILVPDEFSDFWAIHQSWWGPLGLPINHVHAGPSCFGTTFEMMEFEGHQTLYKHTSGSLNGKLIYVTADFNAKWAQSGGWWDILGLPIQDICVACGPSSHETKFNELGFESGGSIYRHNEGPYSGQLFVINGAIKDCWDSKGAWWGQLGLPISDSYAITGGYGQDFESCKIRHAGSCQVVDCDDDYDFGFPVNYPTAAGWWKSQGWMSYYAGYGYHLGDDWNFGSGDDDYGKPVYAVAQGLITYAGNKGTGWGNCIFIRHDNVPGVGTVTSMYAHLKSMYATGGSVNAGQKIGTVGDAGGVWSPHLHFEIRYGSSTVAGAGYTSSPVSQGPQGQTNPTTFINAH